MRLLARTQHCNNSESHASQITNQARELHGPQGIQQSAHPSCSFRPVIGFNARAEKPITTSLAMQLNGLASHVSQGKWTWCMEVG